MECMSSFHIVSQHIANRHVFHSLNFFLWAYARSYFGRCSVLTICQSCPVFSMGPKSMRKPAALKKQSQKPRQQSQKRPAAAMKAKPVAEPSPDVFLDSESDGQSFGMTSVIIFLVSQHVLKPFKTRTQSQTSCLLFTDFPHTIKLL